MRFPVRADTEKSLLERMKECGLTESDICETFIHTSGPGGQKVNKSAVGVQLRHIPTGITVKCGKTRRQAMNRFFARRQLCEQIEKMKTAGTGSSPADERAAKIRKQKQRRKRRSVSQVSAAAER